MICQFIWNFDNSLAKQMIARDSRWPEASIICDIHVASLLNHIQTNLLKFCALSKEPHKKWNLTYEIDGTVP